MLCAVIGILVVMFDFMVPEKIKEAFSGGVDTFEDEDICYGEDYLNSVFLHEVTISPPTTKAMSVSKRQEGKVFWIANPPSE